jgi:hypothetical protein
VARIQSRIRAAYTGRVPPSWFFLDPHSRDLYPDWERKARAVVGNLRLVAGRYPEDARLASLIGELSVRSPEFATFWSDHRIRPCIADTYDIHHPLLGPLTITQQSLFLARTLDQAMVIVTAAPGSCSQDALTLLAQTIGPTGDPADQGPRRHGRERLGRHPHAFRGETAGRPVAPAVGPGEFLCAEDVRDGR